MNRCSLLVVHNMTKSISLIIDRSVLDRYTEYYFSIHTRARVVPIPRPFHESINTWMIMKRPQMNALKKKWKDFIVWFVTEMGYSGLNIEKCEITQTIYYDNKRRHDPDNTVPKFILDGLVESGMIVDDDSDHLRQLSLKCGVDKTHPRTELLIQLL